MKKFVLMFIPALFCGVVFTSFVSNKTIPKEKGAIGEMYEKSEWWQPILEKFNLKLGAYNNFDNVFVMGMEENSINNGICTLKAATVLIKGEDGSYMLFEADSVSHNIEKRTFDFMPVARKGYALDAAFNEISAIHGSITRLELMDGGGARIISRARTVDNISATKVRRVDVND
jgi:hypothetical protein